MKTKPPTTTIRKHRSIHIQFLAEELEAIQRQAASEMRKTSAWIRKAALDQLKRELVQIS